MTEKQSVDVTVKKKEICKSLLKGVGFGALALCHLIPFILVTAVTTNRASYYSENKSINEENVNKIIREVKDLDEFQAKKSYDKSVLEEIVSDGKAIDYDFFVEMNKLESDEYVELFLKNTDSEKYERYKQEKESKKINEEREKWFTISCEVGIPLTLVATIAFELSMDNDKQGAMKRIRQAKNEFSKVKIGRKEKVEKSLEK